MTLPEATRQLRQKRIFFGVLIGAVALIVGGAMLLMETGHDISRFMPRCVMYELTGLYCAGCGTTRSITSLLHGHLFEAFSYNPLLIAAIPAALVFGANGLLRLYTGKHFLPDYQVPVPWQIGIVVILVIYSIVRNIPIWPFDALVPGAMLH